MPFAICRAGETAGLAVWEGMSSEERGDCKPAPLLKKRPHWYGFRNGDVPIW